MLQLENSESLKFVIHNYYVTQMLGRVVTEENEDALADWLQAASPEGV